MSAQDLTFEIARIARIDVDLHGHRAVISCETKQGRSIHLRADIKILEQIHEQVQSRWESLWT